MKPESCPSSEKIQAFLNDELDEPDLGDVSRHLEQCPICERKARRDDAPLDSVLESLRDPTSVLPATEEPATDEPPPTLMVGDPFRTRIDKPAGPCVYPFLKSPQHDGDLGRLAGYRVLGLLGAGGMAFIFRAEDEVLRRPVALKVMKPEFSAKPEFVARFLREAHVMGAIEHDHVVQIYQTGQDGETIFLAMELLPGETLDSWMNRKPRPEVADVIRLGKQIASGLAAIHASGIVHRDIKPSNIWLHVPTEGIGSGVRGRPTFRAKILDFGLAGLMNVDSDLTKSGTVLGTPSYMSPEQARGKKVDVRSDLFSLGCILYRLSTGQKPFDDEHLMAALTSLAIDIPRPATEFNTDVPVELSELIDELLEKEPDDRPATAHEVFERLRTIERGLADPTVGKKTVDVRAGSPPGRKFVRTAAKERTKKASPAPKRWMIALIATTGLAGGVAGLAIFLITRPAPMAGPAAAKTAKPMPANPIFLADLAPIAKENWPFKHGEEKGKGKVGGDFGPVIVQGRMSPHGIFMHPPPPPNDGSPASLTYSLDRKYDRFWSEVGLNDGANAAAPITFNVYGDGKKLWTSANVLSAQDRQTCDVPVKGVDRLKIEVATPGPIHGAHAVWVEPCVSK